MIRAKGRQMVAGNFHRWHSKLTVLKCHLSGFICIVPLAKILTWNCRIPLPVFLLLVQCHWGPSETKNIHPSLSGQTCLQSPETRASAWSEISDPGSFLSDCNTAWKVSGTVDCHELSWIVGNWRGPCLALVPP